MEMAFAGRTGLDIDFAGLSDSSSINADMAVLFSEELGAVIQVRHTDTDDVMNILSQAGLGMVSTVIGTTIEDQIRFHHSERELVSGSRVEFQQAWSETTRDMQALRNAGMIKTYRTAAPQDSRPVQLH